MKNYFLFFTLFSFALVSKAQIGLGTSNPNKNALIDISTPNKGLLLNTLKLKSSNDPFPFKSHEEGLWVYNTEATNNLQPGLHYNDGTKWVAMSTNSTTNGGSYKVGEIKTSIQTTDHNGWYLLDGRNINGLLSTNAIANANKVGITNLLPDSRNKLIKGIADGESFATTGGSNTFVLKKENLPDFTVTGKTSTDGSHTHTYLDEASQRRGFSSINLGAQVSLHRNGTKTTSTDGEHTHKISLEVKGNDKPISLDTKRLTTNYFIYLGL